MMQLPRSTSGRDTLLAVVLMVLLAALVIVVFQPVLRAPFAFDDKPTTGFVRDFPNWQRIWGWDAFGFFRPVKNLFFFAVERAGGGVGLYHGMNLGAYLLAVLAVFGLTLRLCGNVWASFASGAIWALAPTCGTIANWISCFNINIAAASIALCVTAYDTARSGGKHRRIAAAAAAFFLVLGLLSYETAIATAPLLVLVDIFRGREILGRRPLLIYGSVALTVLAWIACRHFAGAAGVQAGNPSVPPDMPGWQLSASAPYFLWTHFLMWAAPDGRLEMLGSYLWNRSIPAIILPFCWVFLLGLIYLLVRLRSRAPLFVFGVAWFLIASMPSGNFLPLRNTPYADYYVPIPSIGLCIALAAILRGAFLRLRAPGATRPAMAAALATIVATVGWRAAQVPALLEWLDAWQIPVRVTARTAATRPHQYYANAVTAYLLATMDDLNDKDIIQMTETCARLADQDMPDMWMVDSALGMVAWKKGNRDEAIQRIQKALVAPGQGTRGVLWCHRQLAVILMEDPSQFERTKAHLLVLLRQRDNPEHPEFVLLTAKFLREAGKAEDELATLERGHLHHPSNEQILRELEEARARAAKQS